MSQSLFGPCLMDGSVGIGWFSVFSRFLGCWARLQSLRLQAEPCLPSASVSRNPKAYRP